MIRLKFLALVVLFLACWAVPSRAADGDAALKAQMIKILRENPEILMDALAKDKVGLYKLAAQGGDMLRKERWRKQVEKRADDPLRPKIEPGQAMLGSPDAPFTVVEYTDFLCPACRVGFGNSKSLVKMYPDKFKVYLKHNTSEGLGEDLACYFEAIARQSQDKAWAFAGEVFADQKTIKKDKLAAVQALVKKLGLDQAKLARDLADPAIKARIKADTKEAEKFKLFGTPGFVIQGVPVEGAAPVSLFLEVTQILENAVKKAPKN